MTVRNRGGDPTCPPPGRFGPLARVLKGGFCLLDRFRDPSPPRTGQAGPPALTRFLLSRGYLDSISFFTCFFVKPLFKLIPLDPLQQEKQIRIEIVLSGDYRISAT